MPSNQQEDSSSLEGSEYEFQLSQLNKESSDKANDTQGSRSVKRHSTPPLEALNSQFEAESVSDADIKSHRRPHYTGRIFGLKRYKRSSRRQKNAGPTHDREDPYGEEAFPEARVWQIYNQKASVHDAERIEAWRDILDILPVYIGLFSAVVSTFVVQTSQKETPQSEYAGATAILAWEVLQAIANASSPNPNPVSINFPDPRSIPSPIPTTRQNLVNTLWFTSLTVSLSAGLGAILVKQWLFNYTKAISGNSRERARIQQFRRQGLEKYRVAFIIEVLLSVLILSLLLFLVGLVLFLSELDGPGVFIVGTIAALTFVFFLTSLSIPVLDPQCPFRSPLASYVYQVDSLSTTHLRTVQTYISSIRRQASRLGHETTQPSAHTLPPTSVVEAEKVIVSRRASELDANSLVWLYNTTPDSTVRMIILEAFGGLMPSSVDTRAIYQILDRDLYLAVKKCSVAGDGHLRPLRGMERQHDRLLRAFCVGNRLTVDSQLRLELQGVDEEEQDPAKLYRSRVLPWFTSDRPREWHNLSSHFLPCEEPGAIFPLPVWAALIRIAHRRAPHHPVITMVLLSLLSRPLDQSEKGPVKLAVAVQHPHIRALVLSYMGIPLRRTMRDTLRVFRLCLTNLLQQEVAQQTAQQPTPTTRPSLLPYLPFFFKTLLQAIDLHGSSQLLTADRAVIRGMLAEFVEFRHASQVSWEVIPLILKLSKHRLQHLRELSVPALYLHILERFCQFTEPDEREMEYVKETLAELTEFFRTVPHSHPFELAEVITTALRELDMLPLGIGSTERTGLCLFWSKQTCDSILVMTKELQGVWNGRKCHDDWIGYIHTPERLAFLSQQMIFMGLQDPSWTNHLCQLQPESVHWPSCLESLLALYDDGGHLDQMVDEEEHQVQRPRYILSTRLGQMKEYLSVHHDLSGSMYDIPQFDENDAMVSCPPDGMDHTAPTHDTANWSDSTNIHSLPTAALVSPSGDLQNTTSESPGAAVIPEHASVIGFEDEPRELLAEACSAEGLFHRHTTINMESPVSPQSPLSDQSQSPETSAERGDGLTPLNF